MKYRIQLYGERAALVSELDAPGLRALQSALEQRPPSRFLEFVLGYDSCLLIFDRLPDLTVLQKWLANCSTGPSRGRPARPPRVVEVPVVYDGPDLSEVADRVGLEEAEVVAIHRGGRYRVRMMGFAPGFPYLDGLDARLHLARKSSPRNRIEPGSVAIGGPHAGIYSVASPGGWHILGRTPLKLFRPENARDEGCAADTVFALAPGDEVLFIEANAGV